MTHAWRDDLKCYVDQIDYDAGRQAGVIHMPEGSCTDMGGAINLFRKIDPDVVAIRTYAGKRLDTCYFRFDDGWEAFLPGEIEAWTGALIPEPENA